MDGWAMPMGADDELHARDNRMLVLVHMLPLPPSRHQCLQPDPALRQLLASIPLPKFVFTNADRRHAARCLNLMGLEGCFDGVICFEDVMEAAAEVR